MECKDILSGITQGINVPFETVLLFQKYFTRALFTFVFRASESPLEYNMFILHLLEEFGRVFFGVDMQKKGKDIQVDQFQVIVPVE